MAKKNNQAKQEAKAPVAAKKDTGKLDAKGVAPKAEKIQATKSEIKPFIEKPRHGWNSEQEVCNFIGSLISMTKAKTVLEVGTFEGRTSLEMIKAVPLGGYVASIDIVEYMPAEIKAEIKKEAEGKVFDFFLGNSLKVIPTLPAAHFDLVFIDGNHEYNHLMAEFKACERVLARGGVIAFHDSLHLPDVKRIVEYAASWGYSYVNLNTPEGRGLALVMRK